MSDTAIAVPAATATNTRPQKRHKRPSVSLVQWLTLAIVALFVVVPFYTTLLGGFKGIGELRTNPFGLPQVWDPSNFLGIIVWKMILAIGRCAFDALDEVAQGGNLLQKTTKRAHIVDVEIDEWVFLIHHMLHGRWWWWWWEEMMVWRWRRKRRMSRSGSSCE